LRFLPPRVVRAEGGPDGGDGGRGGSVIFEADVHTDNLTQFFYEPNVKAKSGQHGMGKQCYGKAAPDKIVKVPVGTIVYRIPGEAPDDGLDPSLAYGTDATFIDFSKSPSRKRATARRSKRARRSIPRIWK
jgi:GTP-binding protein